MGGPGGVDYIISIQACFKYHMVVTSLQGNTSCSKKLLECITTFRDPDETARAAGGFRVVSRVAESRAMLITLLAFLFSILLNPPLHVTFSF